MEEKERYEIHIYDDVCVDLYNNGVLDKSINDTYKLEELLNQQDKRIKELEEENQQIVDILAKYGIESVEELNERLKNAIVPKFKVGQEIWETTPLMSWKIKRIECHKFNNGNGDVVMEIYKLGHDGTDDYNCCIMPVDNDRFFATKEEAEQKLAEIKGEKDE